MNVFGGDSDNVQLCVNILHQILGSLPRCRVMASICTVSSGKRMRGTTHAGGGLVRRSGSVQHGPRVVFSHTGKACALLKLQGHELLIFLPSAVNFVKVSCSQT